MSRADVVVLFHALKTATHPEHIRELSAAQEVAERNGDLGGHVVCALYRVEELRSICDAFAGVDAGYAEAMAEIRAMRESKAANDALKAAARAYMAAVDARSVTAPGGALFHAANRAVIVTGSALDALTSEGT